MRIERIKSRKHTLVLTVRHLLQQFQDVTLCLVAERGILFSGDGVHRSRFHGKTPFAWLPWKKKANTSSRDISLDDGSARSTYLHGELARFKVSIPSPRNGCKYLVYCSPNNAGALEFMEEVASSMGAKAASSKAQQSALSRLSVQRLRRSFAGTSDCLLVTADPTKADSCERFLVFLTRNTWKSGEMSLALAEEIARAMDRKACLLLCHEMLGEEEEERCAVDFGALLVPKPGGTPVELVRRGIYKQIAIPLKGGAWRQASMVMTAQALAATATAGSFESGGPSVPNSQDSPTARRRLTQQSQQPSADLMSSRAMARPVDQMARPIDQSESSNDHRSGMRSCLERQLVQLPPVRKMKGGSETQMVRPAAMPSPLQVQQLLTAESTSQHCRGSGSPWSGVHTKKPKEWGKTGVQFEKTAMENDEWSKQVDDGHGEASENGGHAKISMAWTSRHRMVQDDVLSEISIVSEKRPELRGDRVRI